MGRISPELSISLHTTSELGVRLGAAKQYAIGRGWNLAGQSLATVVIGGLFTSTALTLVVLPALYGWLAEREAGKEYAPEWV